MPRFKKQIIVDIELDALDERDAQRRAQVAADKLPATLIKGGFQTTISCDLVARLSHGSSETSTEPVAPRRSALAEILASMPEETVAPPPPVVVPVATSGAGAYLAADANGGRYFNTLATHTSTPNGGVGDVDQGRSAMELAAPDLYAACEKVAESCALVLKSMPLPQSLADHLRLVEKITRAAVAKASLESVTTK